jgi:hypothetical protein
MGPTILSMCYSNVPHFLDVAIPPKVLTTTDIATCFTNAHILLDNGDYDQHPGACKSPQYLPIHSKVPQRRLSRPSSLATELGRGPKACRE